MYTMIISEAPMASGANGLPWSTVSPTVPRLHPGLAPLDEHEMDVPAFLRRGHPTNTD